MDRSTVISQFKSIDNKKASRFLKFDIVNFYPSKTEKLLDNSIIFAKHHTILSDQNINIFQHSRKTLSLDFNDIWIKNSHSLMFDVTVGRLDVAEIRKFVGLNILAYSSTDSFLSQILVSD